MNEKEKLEIKKWGESLIKRMHKLHDYLSKRLWDENVEKSEKLLILEYTNLLGDLQIFIEIRGFQ